jgi:hypothetical protein
MAPAQVLYKKHITEAMRKAEFPGFFHGSRCRAVQLNDHSN